MRTLFSLLLMMALPLSAAPQTRLLMDLVDVQGIRDNQLVGYGLVVGLTGTGDKSQVKFTAQSVVNMLKQFGVQINGTSDPKLKNVAAVAIHGTVPPLASPGQSIDVTVSSIGDAKSLRGGTLLMTPLRGVDGEVYAVAQGNLVVGGITAQGRDGTSVTVNVPTVGTIPNGALLEAAIPSSFQSGADIVLNLKRQSFKTARNIERTINDTFGPDVARAESNAKVRVHAPENARQRVTFMSMLEELDIEPGRRPARVVFNSRTGTVVMGADVRVHKAAVSHGNLMVAITEQTSVSQPGAFAGGQTQAITNSSINIDQGEASMFVWPEGTSLETIVKAVNSLGAAPTDLMAILQALDEAGALDAELVVM